MKRAIAIIFAVIVLLLCGCSNKVEQAQAMLDNGDYQGAIEIAEEILDGDSGNEATSEATEIKAIALYKLQWKAYNDRLFGDAATYSSQIKELGSDTSVYYMSQKVSVVVSAEQELETMHDAYDKELWDNAIDCEKKIQRLAQQRAMSYGENDELNSRMDEIISASAALSDKARLGRWYDELLNYVESGDAEGIVRAAEAIHNYWPESKEDLIAQEYLSQALEQVEQAEEEREQDLRDTIRVSRIWTSEPNFLGTVDLFINFTNTSNKTIKYITFYVKFYNAVGDVVECEVKRPTEGKSYLCGYVGPCEPGDGLSGTSYGWGSYFNSTIDHPELVGVVIEYMDGTKISISSGDIDIIQY